MSEEAEAKAPEAIEPKEQKEIDPKEIMDFLKPRMSEN